MKHKSQPIGALFSLHVLQALTLFHTQFFLLGGVEGFHSGFCCRYQPELAVWSYIESTKATNLFITGYKCCRCMGNT